MLFRLVTIGVVLVSLCSADTLTLRSGRVVSGQYLGGDARHIRMAIGDHVDTFDVDDVGDLQFGGNTPPAPPPADRMIEDENKASPNSRRPLLRRYPPASRFLPAPRSQSA